MRHTSHTQGLTFERQLATAIRRLGLTQSGVLLAVSGGTDSVALLVAASAVAGGLGLRLEVASLDHGLREASAQDVAHVRALCEARGLPFHTRSLGVRAGPGVEARAREARYAALEQLRAERGLAAVATGHTASDQAETLLMRLARGSALRGAAGILERRGAVVRPILWATRAQTAAYLTAAGSSAREDPMNADPAFLRVRVRQDALPALERSAGPGVAQRLAQFAAHAAEDEALLGALAAQAVQRLVLPGGGLDAVGLRALPGPLRRRALVALLAQAGLPADAQGVALAEAAVERGGVATLPGGFVLRAQSGEVRCVAPDVPAIPFAPLTLGALDQVVRDEAAGLELGLSARAPADALWAPLAALHLPLTVRRREPGDRTAGTRRRRLQDLLVDAKIPRETRDALPVVADATGGVVWVVGVWPSARSAAGCSGTYLWARPTGSLRAQDWLVRYRVAGAERRPK